MNATRRDAVKAATALVLGFYLPERGRAEQNVGVLNAWIKVSPDNQVTLFTETPEMGQGTRTANAMMLAEELEIDWVDIRVEQAPTLPAVYKHLTTGGSGGTESTWLPLRRAGAQARELLIASAALTWNCPREECRAQSGRIIHIPTERKFTYGALAAQATQLPVPALDKVALKNPKDFRLIGKPLPRVDVPAKVNGSATFGLDVRVPGMLFAVIARCPYFGGTLKTFDGSDAKATPGVKAVFAVCPSRKLLDRRAALLDRLRIPFAETVQSASFNIRSHRFRQLRRLLPRG